MAAMPRGAARVLIAISLAATTSTSALRRTGEAQTDAASLASVNATSDPCGDPSARLGASSRPEPLHDNSSQARLGGGSREAFRTGAEAGGAAATRRRIDAAGLQVGVGTTLAPVWPGDDPQLIFESLAFPARAQMAALGALVSDEVAAIKLSLANVPMERVLEEFSAKLGEFFRKILDKLQPIADTLLSPESPEIASTKHILASSSYVGFSKQLDDLFSSISVWVKFDIAMLWEGAYIADHLKAIAVSGIALSDGRPELSWLKALLQRGVAILAEFGAVFPEKVTAFTQAVTSLIGVNSSVFDPFQEALRETWDHLVQVGQDVRDCVLETSKRLPPEVLPGGAARAALALWPLALATAVAAFGLAA